MLTKIATVRRTELFILNDLGEKKSPDEWCRRIRLCLRDSRVPYTALQRSLPAVAPYEKSDLTKFKRRARGRLSAADTVGAELGRKAEAYKIMVVMR